MPTIGHGIDIVDIARIKRMLADHPERFLERCFTPAEVEYCRAGKAGPWSGRSLERLSGRFAMKEAVLKALGTGWRHGIAWTDIETLPDDSGRPVIRLCGQALRFAEAAGVTRWCVSISHTSASDEKCETCGGFGGIAMASAIAIGGENSP